MTSETLREEGIRSTKLQELISNYLTGPGNYVLRFSEEIRMFKVEKYILFSFGTETEIRQGDLPVRSPMV